MMTARAALDAAYWMSEPSFAAGFLPEGVAVGFSGIKETPPEHLRHAKQVHGTMVVAAADLPQEADGVHTTKAGEIVAVKTADCLPVLFAHPKWVSAVHAGWRGLAKGILKEALKVAREHDAALSQMRVIVGPAISAAAFEIGPEVVAAIQDGPQPFNDTELALCLLKGVSDRWHFDLQQAAVLMLMHSGVDPRHVAVVRTCTRSSQGRWHSFRRDKEKAGSNWSWIMRT